MPLCEWSDCAAAGTHTVIVTFPGEGAETWSVCREHDAALKWHAVASRPQCPPPEPTPTTVEMFCGDCMMPLDEPSNLPAEERVPCPQCGGSLRHVKVGIFETVSVHESIRVRTKTPGKGGYIVDARSGDDYTRLLEGWGKRELMMDRAQNRYREAIQLPDGTSIESTAKLTDHRG